MSSANPALLGGTPIRPDGPPGWPLDDPAVIASAHRALTEGAWGRYLSEYGETWRARLAAFHNVRHVRCCASGTAGIELALRGLGVGRGDEVLMAAYDFPANFKNILALGAKPVLVDIRPDDAQIDIDSIDAAASPHTKTLLVSHLHGSVADMPRLRTIADAAGWGIIEDACQMPGAWIAGRRAGTWGDAGVISFGGSKLLTAGRGGAVITDRDDVAQRIRLFVERGNDLSPLSEIQAALLIPQLDRLDERRRIRAAAVMRLRQSIAEIPGLRPFAQHSSDDSDTEPDFYKFPLWYDAESFEGLPREIFSAAVRAEGAALWPAFRGLHRIHSAKRYRAVDSLAIADAADEQLLVLHHPVLLGTEQDIEQISEILQKIATHAAKFKATSLSPQSYS